MLFGLLFNGLAFPRLSAAFGAAWIVGRVAYTYGYNTGVPEKRYAYGGSASLSLARGGLPPLSRAPARSLTPLLGLPQCFTSSAGPARGSSRPTSRARACTTCSSKSARDARVLHHLECSSLLAPRIGQREGRARRREGHQS